jgi:K+-sensing histidine kinase KdpD
VTDNSSPADDSLNISLDDIPSTDAPAVKNEILNLDDNLDSSSDLLNDEISFNEDELDAGLAESTPELDPVSESSPDTLPADKAAPVEEKAPEEPEPVIRKTTFSGTNSFELLEKINDAAQLVNSNIKIEKVLQNIVKVATDLTSADRGTLYLVEKDKNELWSMIAMGNDFKEIKLKIGEGIAGWVAQKGDTINLENAQEDSRFNVSFDKTSGYTTKSMICFPIKDRNNEICGVLQLLNSSNGKFSKVDEELLEALSYHAAMALQNAELVEQLLKGERISSLGKMANFLIQDIKKPIMVSKRYTEHLKSKELPEDLSKVVDMVLEQLDHIAELVNSTSNYSEGQIVSRSHLRSINEVLEEFVTRIESFVVSRNCNIVHDLEKDVNVQVSEKQLYQAFQHLIKNACDAMPDGGEITLFTENVDNGVAITVKDSGLGIPETLHEKIFEPFMSHGKKEGTGLGLSITKKIVEEHSGSISVASEIGEGAKFTITLPIASA